MIVKQTSSWSPSWTAVEIDLTQTNLDEYLSCRDLEPTDKESLAWRTFWLPCHDGSAQECLGLAVKNREFRLGTTCAQTVLTRILAEK